MEETVFLARVAEHSDRFEDMFDLVTSYVKEKNKPYVK